MKLEDIGFYTLSDARCKNASATSPLQRCELILTSRCNFKCPYCRHVGGKDTPYQEALDVVSAWAERGLKNIRFSGGEPTLVDYLPALVRFARLVGIKRVAISTNGSASWELYQKLIDAGASDFSVSLDACCAEDCDKMTGGVKGMYGTVVDNIKKLSSKVYTTVGVVLTETNEARCNEIVAFAASMGVSDIRIIPAAQHGTVLKNNAANEEYTKTHPILAYRADRLKQGLPVRGIGPQDSRRCALVLDDMAVNHGKHYPCIIYMREGGKPIGKVGPNMRAEREQWSRNHRSDLDPICSKNCIDVCVAYNNKWEEFHPHECLLPTKQIHEAGKGIMAALAPLPNLASWQEAIRISILSSKPYQEES